VNGEITTADKPWQAHTNKRHYPIWPSLYRIATPLSHP
jgi:hypothetical protein